jgi:hypothetical protein
VENLFDVLRAKIDTLLRSKTRGKTTGNIGLTRVA